MSPFKCHLPIQRQNTNSKVLTIEKLSKSDLRRCTKFGQFHSNDEEKITVTSSTENTDLARKRKLGPK